MGSLTGFSRKCKSLDDIRKQYNQSVFVETGCYLGESLRYAFSSGYTTVYSCDVKLEFVDQCKQAFKYKDANIYHMDSSDYLKQIIPDLPEQSVLFFLDAHLPGWYYGAWPPNSNFEHDVNFPLEKELDIIFSKRSRYEDVIVCDDLRIYEDGPYEGGIWADRLTVSDKLNSDFLSKYNRKVSKFYADEGYVLLEGI
jgi:hypothetical protein